MKLVAITLMSILMPKTMGHYLIIKLLSIEDENSDDFRIMDTISKLKKKITEKDILFSKNNNKTNFNFIRYYFNNEWIFICFFH